MALMPESAVLQFSRLQSDLLSAFFKAFPSAADDFMSSAPKRGEVMVGADVWQFRKHGSGVMFQNKTTRVVVDSHRIFKDVPSAIDAWRFMQFMESLGVSPITESVSEQWLRSAVESGTLVETNHEGVYAVKITSG